MKPRLPGKREFIFIAPPGYRRFKLANDGSNGTGNGFAKLILLLIRLGIITNSPNRTWGKCFTPTQSLVEYLE